MARRVNTCKRSKKLALLNDSWMTRTVLHDIANDTEFVEVASTALCAERLFEGDLQY